MGEKLLLFLVISTLISQSSCVSVHKKLAKQERIDAIYAKIDSREYRIDIYPPYRVETDGPVIYVPEYFQVSGDSLISCMLQDNLFSGSFPPKGYAEQMKSSKYKIFDYKQIVTRSGRRIVSFWVKIKYVWDDIYFLTRYEDQFVPIYYKLEFGKTLKVRVLQNEYPMSGVLSL